MSKKVTYAKLHAGVFIPTVGNLSDTLPPQSKTLQELTMTTQPNGNLHLAWYDERKNEERSAEVGASNIIVLAYESSKRVKKVNASNSSDT